VVSWARFVSDIEPHYPSGKRGRPPIGIEWMLRIYFLLQWYAMAVLDRVGHILGLYLPVARQSAW
jgi:hypothetical protein